MDSLAKNGAAPDIKVQPTLFKICMNLSASYDQQGKRDDAIKILSMVTQFNEENKGAWMHPAELSQFRNNLAVMQHKAGTGAFELKTIRNILDKAMFDNQKAQ